MLTATFEQLAFYEGEAPPARHELCDPETHVYSIRNGPRRGALAWRLLPSCKGCCAYVSDVLVKFRKRMRRQFGDDVRYLWAREEHKSGAIHVHMAWAGLPPMSRYTKHGKWVKNAFHEVGGGFMDLGEIYQERGKAGWYIGKYLAKQHGEGMARGYRRWSRTYNFAPGMVLHPEFGPAKPARDPDPWHKIGWLHPLSDEPWAIRFWLPASAAFTASVP